MLKIGDFSKLSRISIRMLRHYDRLGLLVPKAIDESTGYRYYSEAQLPRAGRIQALKNLGFGLQIIAEILEKYEDAKEMEQFLLIKKREMEEQEKSIRKRLRLLDSTIEWLRKDGKIMGYDVSLKTLPERYVASVRQVIPAYDQEGILWGIMMQETAPQHMQDANPGYALSIYHDGEFKEQDVDVEIQKCVSGTYQDTEHVKFRHMPPVEIASATYKGTYEQITQVNEAVAKWVADNGYEMDGLSFCIYHVAPSDTQNPDEYVTEVCYPVKKK